MHDFVRGIDWLTNAHHWAGPDGVPSRLWEHVQLSAISLVLAALIAVPVGLWVGHTKKGQVLATQFASLGRSIPSYAVLSISFLIVVKISPREAFGFLPTIAALVLLGIPAIMINTFVGIAQVDADTVEAARGMGMSGAQVLRRLEVPIAMPLIMTGLRLAAVQIVATAGLAALVAGGGLGRYIVDGYSLRETPKIVAGAILIALLAVLTDLAFSLLARLTAPRLTSTPRSIRAGAA